MKILFQLLLIAVMIMGGMAVLTGPVNSQTRDTVQLDTISFSGIVYQGDHFEIELDSYLSFGLIPQPEGWIIWMGNPQDPSKDYVSVATPPFRGLNARLINGWHFRNIDNSGPNLPGDKNVNAPGELRTFYFVLNDSDYIISCQLLDIMLWSYNHSEQEVNQAGNQFSNLPRGEGLLYVDSLVLTNLIPGEKAVIQTLGFKVDLFLPEL